MKNPKQILCDIGTLEDGSMRQRIQVFPAPGEYVHPMAGPFTLTDDTNAEFAADINARGASIPLDRDHAFFKRQAAPAAGWFVPGTARVEDDGTVTAEVDWTPGAAEQIRNREYRFISPEFSMARTDTGGRKIPEPTVHAATVTNRPFFTTMEPIAAEDLALEDELVVADAFGDEIADSLLAMDAAAVAAIVAAAQAKSKEPYGNVAYADPGYRKDGKKRYPIDSEEHVRAAWSYINQKRNAAMYEAAQLSRIKARIKRAAKKFGITIGADATHEEDTMDLTAMAVAFGLAADASEDDVLEAARRVAAENAELKTKIEALPSDEMLKTLVADAQQGVAAAKKLAEVEKKTALDAAVTSGRIVPAEREHYEKLWDYDPEGVGKLLAEKPVAVTFTATETAAVIGADGQPLPAGADGQPITADLTPVKVDGVEMEIGVDSARITAAAEAHLRRSGKTSWTDDEFVAACEAVMPTLGLSR